jgi:DNA-binding CsgD family transcriptional regulator
MSHDLPNLDRATLLHLRTLVTAMHQDNGSAVPLGHLARLADEAQLGAGVTIDFAAAASLGLPLVVLRMPRDDASGRISQVLSKREFQVAALLAEGLTNKQIARRLFLSIATVKDHVHRILVKTGLPNRAAGGIVRPGGRVSNSIFGYFGVVVSPTSGRQASKE